MNTKEKILQTTEELILKNGINTLTLSEVAQQLNLSQPAIYKHFKNKEALLTTLAFNWLNLILKDLFPFSAPSKSTGRIAHDWLWTLAVSKKNAYEQSPEMFALYTNYIAENQALTRQHFEDLYDSFQKATNIKDKTFISSLIQAFTFFHHPYLAPQWDKDFSCQFENVWRLVKRNFVDNKS